VHPIEFTHYIEVRRNKLVKWRDRDLFQWWIDSDYPSLRQWAFDTLSVPIMSIEIERVFSQTKRSIPQDRNRLTNAMVEATQCMKHWFDSGLLYPDQPSIRGEGSPSWEGLAETGGASRRRRRGKVPMASLFFHVSAKPDSYSSGDSASAFSTSGFCAGGGGLTLFHSDSKAAKKPTAETLAAT
jgi:hypothetical protein